jgi:hypothetical protein
MSGFASKASISQIRRTQVFALSLAGVEEEWYSTREFFKKF